MGSGPKAENQVIRLVIRIKTTHDVHFGNNVGKDLLGASFTKIRPILEQEE